MLSLPRKKSRLRFSYHLVDAGEGVLALQNGLPLGAAILGSGMRRRDRPSPTARRWVCQSRVRDEDLLLGVFIWSLTKVWRRSMWVWDSQLFVVPVDFAEGAGYSCRVRSIPLSRNRRGATSAKTRAAGYSFGELIGGSEAMITCNDALSGVSGYHLGHDPGRFSTGKELERRAIVVQQSSPRTALHRRELRGAA